MLPIIIGIILICLGLFLLPFGYAELKDELEIVGEEKSFFKRWIVYIVTFISFLDFSSYLGFILSLALLFIFSGGAFIILAIF